MLKLIKFKSCIYIINDNFKKILNFDTRNNIDYNKNPYQNCILNLRTSYKNILTMTLKSVELTTIKKFFDNGIGNTTKPNDFSFIVQGIYYNVSIPYFQQTDTIEYIIQKTNDALVNSLNENNFINTSIIFSLNENGFITVEFKNFQTPETDLQGNYFIQQLGFNIKTNIKVYKNFNLSYDTNTITFGDLPAVVQTFNYLNIYFSNLPYSGGSNADGSPSTFKIPLSSVLNSNTNNDVYFYNENNNYKQSIDIMDKNFIFNQLNVNLYNTKNKIFTSPFKLDWSFSIEIEYFD